MKPAWMRSHERAGKPAFSHRSNLVVRVEKGRHSCDRWELLWADHIVATIWTRPHISEADAIRQLLRSV